jgi:hypothetical protein
MAAMFITQQHAVLKTQYLWTDVKVTKIALSVDIHSYVQDVYKNTSHSLAERGVSDLQFGNVRF